MNLCAEESFNDGLVHIGGVNRLRFSLEAMARTMKVWVQVKEVVRAIVLHSLDAAPAIPLCVEDKTHSDTCKMSNLARIDWADLGSLHPPSPSSFPAYQKLR